MAKGRIKIYITTWEGQDFFSNAMKDLSIVILSYNTRDLLKKCLHSIYQGSTNLNCEIIVVDNASSDDSVNMVKTMFPKVKLVMNKINLGYSSGNNLGVSQAAGDLIFILNSDTEIIGECLKIMIEFARRNQQIGIIGPKIFNPDGSVQNSVGSFYSLGHVLALMFGLEKRLGIGRISPQNFSLVDWVSGSAMLIRRADFEKLGGFDEKLFMYMEEVEFCYRAKLAGIRTGFLPEAQIIHKGLGSSSQGSKNATLGIFKGLVYFYEKYFPGWRLTVLKFILKTKAAIYFSFGLLIGNNNLKSTYEQAFRLVK